MHLWPHIDKSSGVNVGFTGMRQQVSQFGQHAGHDHLHCRTLGTGTCMLRQKLQNRGIRAIFGRLTTRNVLLERT